MSKHLLDDLNDNALTAEEQEFLDSYGDRFEKVVDKALALRLTLRSRSAALGTALSDESLDALACTILQLI